MARGGRPERSREQVYKDRAEIAQRYLRGELQAEIGKHLGLSQQQVSVDLKHIRAAWLESALVDFNAKKAEELAKYDLLERTHWDAWQESCKASTRTTQYLGNDGKISATSRAVVETTEKYGDPRFLEGVERCIAKRCELLGLEAPKRTTHEHSGPGGGAIALEIEDIREQLARKLEAVVQARTSHADPQPDEGTSV